MTDTFSTKKRSEIMRAIKSRGNASTERKLIQLFKTNKISGWRRNSIIFGRPDFVFPQRRVALFADGCFWHGHGCRNLTPAQNAEYWQKKIQRNIERDKEVTKALKKQNWQVVRIWECEISHGNIGKLKRRL
ncbi:MAG: DNA mismatch endonuclease Vsr [Anaerolineales bacterium]|nr:DNA mismatch endonuclease Vsr [Anaerolineales bacterium]